MVSNFITILYVKFHCIQWKIKDCTTQVSQMQSNFSQSWIWYLCLYIPYLNTNTLAKSACTHCPPWAPHPPLKSNSRGPALPGLSNSTLQFHRLMAFFLMKIPGEPQKSQPRRELQDFATLHTDKWLGKDLLVVSWKEPKGTWHLSRSWRDVSFWVSCLMQGVSRRIVC